MRYTSLIIGASLFLVGSAYLVSHYVEVARLKAQDSTLELLISASPNPSPDISPSVTPSSSPPATISPESGGGGGGGIPIGGDNLQPIKVELVSPDGTAINARFGPNLNYGVAESYPNGTVVFLNGKRHPSGWLQLVTGNWVRETLVVGYEPQKPNSTESPDTSGTVSVVPNSNSNSATGASCRIAQVPNLMPNIVTVDEQTILTLSVSALETNSCKLAIALPPSISASPNEFAATLEKGTPITPFQWLLTPQKLGMFTVLVRVGDRATTLHLRVRDALGLTSWQTKLIAGIATLLGGGLFTVGLTLNPRK